MHASTSSATMLRQDQQPCIAESWVKRRYEKSFVNKLTDSLSEENEPEVWLDYSKDCKYIQEETHERLLSEYAEVRKMLISMINNPDKWCF